MRCNNRERPWIPYVVPFAVFMVFTEASRHLPGIYFSLYLAKTLITAWLLWYWRKNYIHDMSGRLTSRQVLEAVSCGLLVLCIWILGEGRLFKLQQDLTFDPYVLGNGMVGLVTVIGVRLLGSSLVVPVMEEIFWRSFLMRWLIADDFHSIPLGTFSWFSFIGTAILFGLEHNRVVAGICAGILYNLLLVHQHNLRGVILAHGVTNLGLGLYVILFHQWGFW